MLRLMTTAAMLVTLQCGITPATAETLGASTEAYDTTCRGFLNVKRPLRGTESASAIWIHGSKCVFFEYAPGTPGKRILDTCRNDHVCEIKARVTNNLNYGSQDVASHTIERVYSVKEIRQ